MSKAQGGNLLFRLVWLIRNNPIRIFEIAQFLLLAWVLLQTLIGFGGFLAYGLPMTGVSKSLVVLSLVHLIVILGRPGCVAFNWVQLVPLPFLFYALLHWLYLSPYSWNAAPLFCLYLQAYALLLITCNSVYSMRTARWMMKICEVLVLLAVAVALLRHYVFPDWIQDASRVSDPAYANGAGGFLQDPANLANLLLLMLPLMLILVAKYRFNGPARLYAIAMVGVIVMGFILSSNFWGFMLIPVMLVATPFFISDRWRTRRTFWQWCLVLTPVGVFLMYLLMGPAYDRLVAVLLNRADFVGEASRVVAIRAVEHSPLTGAGLGGYSLLWDQYTPLAGTASRHAIGSYHELLAEMGWIGLILLLASALVYVLWCLSKWSKIPYFRVNPDVARRLKSFPEDHPAHKRLGRDKGRMSTRKVVIGGILLGSLAVLAYAFRDFSLKLPVILFFLSCYCGLQIALCQGFEKQNSGKIRLVPALFPLILTTVAAICSLGHHYANYIVYTASEKLAILQDDPEAVFYSQDDLRIVTSELNMALELVTDHGEAVSKLATAQLLYLAAELEPPIEVALRAQPIIERAVLLNPGSWQNHFNAAIVHLLTGSGNATEDIKKAVKYAPLRIEPRALQAGMQLLQDPDSGAARQALRTVLLEKPDYEPVRRLLRSADLQAGSDGMAVLNAVSLARQFHILPDPHDRVQAAGLMRRD